MIDEKTQERLNNFKDIVEYCQTYKDGVVYTTTSYFDTQVILDALQDVKMRTLLDAETNVDKLFMMLVSDCFKHPV